MYGSFSGNPKTEWLPDNRDMRLLEDFSFTDPDGRVWLAPEGAIINGASIPALVWDSVGSPYVGDYRRASIVHDVACDTSDMGAFPSRKDADVMFFHACRAGGCSSLKARVLYIGVRVGAWASFNIQTCTEGGIGPHGITVMLDKFSAIFDEVKTLPDDASIEQIDIVIGHHI